MEGDFPASNFCVGVEKDIPMGDARKFGGVCGVPGVCGVAGVWGDGIADGLVTFGDGVDVRRGLCLIGEGIPVVIRLGGPNPPLLVGVTPIVEGILGGAAREDDAPTTFRRLRGGTPVLAVVLRLFRAAGALMVDARLVLEDTLILDETLISSPRPVSPA